VSRPLDAIGVIVPAHNEQDLLPSCLASVRRAAQALPGTPVHLVVVADACTDQTAEAARRGGASVVTISARSAGAARGAGALEVLRLTGHLDPASVWLATTDADTLVPDRWLSQQARYAGQGWDAIVGTIQVSGDWNTVNARKQAAAPGDPCQASRALRIGRVRSSELRPIAGLGAADVAGRGQ
jgi:glycosyltransferase involved in cell wall biosynthesis